MSDHIDMTNRLARRGALLAYLNGIIEMTTMAIAAELSEGTLFNEDPRRDKYNARLAASLTKHISYDFTRDKALTSFLYLWAMYIGMSIRDEVRHELSQK